MQRVTSIGCQGDLLFQRVDSLPKDVSHEEGPNAMIVGLSETQHHHLAKARAGYDCERYTDPANPLVSYLRITAKGEELRARADKAARDIDAVLIEHQRSFDTHETLALQCEGDEAVYRVVRQRELTPEGWARAVVD